MACKEKLIRIEKFVVHCSSILAYSTIILHTQRRVVKYIHERTCNEMLALIVMCVIQ